MKYCDQDGLDREKKERASRCTLTLWWRKANRYLFSLAELLSYDHPRASYLSSIPGSAIVKHLAWYWYFPDTKKGYAAVINSYVSFYIVHNERPWRVQTIMLKEWEATRIFGSTTPKQGQIKPDTVLRYFLALKSNHIDRRLSLGGFDDPRMALIIKRRKRQFPSKKRNRLLIRKETLEKITEEEPLSITEPNMDTASKVALAGFMRMGELAYTAAEAKKATFSETCFTRFDISFEAGDHYATLRLKRTKTDIEHPGVQIILAATVELTCPVAAFRTLFIQDPRTPIAPLFRL